MFPKGFRTFVTALVHQLHGRETAEGALLSDPDASYLLELWETLPESTKAQCEATEDAHEQQNNFAAITTQHILPQSSPHDPSPSGLAWKPPAKLVVLDATIVPAATQHVLSSSPSTTPSPSAPLLSPSPFCSPPPMRHNLPHNLSMATPSPSQPEPLNIGDNWDGVQYGASRKVEFLMENQPSHSVCLSLPLMLYPC